MLFKGKEGLELSQTKVRFIENGVEQEKFVGPEGKQWWLNFAEKWNTNVKFTDATYTPEQLARFEEVKETDLSENVLQDYTENGVVGKGLEMLVLKKENEELKQLLADLSEVVLLGGA